MVVTCDIWCNCVNTKMYPLFHCLCFNFFLRFFMHYVKQQIRILWHRITYISFYGVLHKINPDPILKNIINRITSNKIKIDSKNHTYAVQETTIVLFFNVMVYFKIRFYQSWRRQWPYKNYETLYINHNINHCKITYIFWLLKSHFNARCVSPNHNNACSASVHIKMVRLWHDWCPSDIL